MNVLLLFLALLCPAAAFLPPPSPLLPPLAASTIDVTPDPATSSAVCVVTADGKETSKAYSKAVAAAAKEMGTIPGFRKGSKIPAAVIESALAKSGNPLLLVKSALSSLLSSVVEPALKSCASVDPIGVPSLADDEAALAARFAAGEPLELKVRCDVWPAVRFKGGPGGAVPAYHGLSAAYARRPFDEKRFDQSVLDLRDRQASLRPKAEGARLEVGDACVVNMRGFLQKPGGGRGEPLPNAASGDRVDVVLTPGKYMEGLVEGLVGAGAGETREVVVAFPGGLRDKGLAGRTAVFD
ncbi:hypothetical protein TeGR_g9784, partial [Tetraparma gracilis]